MIPGLPLAGRSKFARRISGLGIALIFPLVWANSSPFAAEPPSWAYLLNAPGATQATDNDSTARHIPGSTLTFTAGQIAGRDGVPDWRPNEHPPMPQIVAKGRAPAVRACAYCHLP